MCDQYRRLLRSLSTGLENDESWWLACRLRERAADIEDIDSVATEVRAECGRYRLWQDHQAFRTSHHSLADRLTHVGLTEAQLKTLLGERAGAVKNRLSEVPPWLNRLSESFATGRQGGVHVELSHVSDENKEGRRLAGLLEFVRPFVEHTFQSVTEDVESRSLDRHAPFQPQVLLRQLLRNLCSDLFGLTSRTLVLELNIARVKGELVSETSDGRFRDFVELLRSNATRLAILRRYPALARSIVETCEQWKEACVNLLRAITDDWPAICERLSVDPSRVRVLRVRIGAGDRHRGGRSVAILTLSGDLRVVYKPRSLSVDLHFQQLLQWLNEGGTFGFKCLWVLDCGDHGWMEYVPTRPCLSREEVESFYYRQGALLAVLYCLEAVDFHYENVIACESQPVLVDLESLFQPRTPIADNLLGGPAGEVLAASVLRVGLLPVSSVSDDEPELSGLGGAQGQVTRKALPVFEKPGTDLMRVVRRKWSFPAGDNRPTLDGAVIDVQEFTASIVSGFEAMYDLIKERYSALLADDGCLAAFASDEIRIILRGTEVYGRLLQESHHPHLFRDGLDRDRHFDHLWAPLAIRPFLQRVIEAEILDLHQGDIPVFVGRPNSCDLYSWTGTKFSNFFSANALELVRRRLDTLGHEDRERQVWFIRASLTTLSRGYAPENRPSYTIARHAQRPVGPRELLESAERIGKRLLELSIPSRGGMTWVGLAFVDERRLAVAPIGLSLYDGAWGVALFLAYLGREVSKSEYQKAARETVESAIEQIQEVRENDLRVGIGGFSGWGGGLLALTHLASLWQDTRLLEEAERHVRYISEGVALDASFDVLGGAAGAIGALLSFYAATGSEYALQTARECGEHLLANAIPTGEGLTWPSSVDVERPLCGFSHGASGIAWALHGLSVRTQDQRFRQAGDRAFSYERSFFSAETGNWPDFRIIPGMGPSSRPDGNSYSWSWCHGAPGALLSRVSVLESSEDPVLRGEARAALASTFSYGFGHSHCLCHGDLGNLDIVKTALRKLSCRLQSSIDVSDIEAGIVRNVRKTGPLCGIPFGVETPGFMTGLAGIGFGFLRLARPGTVPNILILDPPIDPEVVQERPVSGAEYV